MGMYITRILETVPHVNMQQVLSTFLEAGFTPKQLGEGAVNALADHLEALLRKHVSVIGFCKNACFLLYSRLLIEVNTDLDM